MSNAVKFLLIALVMSAGILLFITPTIAQELDTVYLKDGSVIKGEIIETNYTTDMRIETIKVRITGGSILVYTAEQILKIQDVVNKNVEEEKKVQISLPKIPPNITIKRKIQNVNYKSPGTACILSLVIFPGIGQFYNEQPGKGALHLGLGLLNLVLMLDGSKEVTTYDYNKGYITEPKNSGQALLGSLGFLFTWIGSGIDAYSSAKDINESLALSVTPNNISLCYRF